MVPREYRKSAAIPSARRMMPVPCPALFRGAGAIDTKPGRGSSSVTLPVAPLGADGVHRRACPELATRIVPAALMAMSRGLAPNPASVVNVPVLAWAADGVNSMGGWELTM